MADVTEPDPRWALVYDEALRALAFQQGTLDNLRSRATLLTAGAGLVGSALGAPALADNRWGAAVLSGRSRDCAKPPSSLLPCSALARLRALVSPDGARSVAPAPVVLAIVALGLVLDGNEKRLRRLQWCFTLGLAALLLEMAAWLVQIAQLRGGR